MARFEYVDHTPKYMVSDEGEVVNVKTHRTLKPCENGYRSVHVFLSGSPKGTYQVRKLVADAFLPPKPSDDHVLTHIDGNYHNCRADNLKWETRSNVQIRSMFMNRGEDVEQPIRVVGTDIVYKNIFECADALDGNPRMIHRTTLNSNWEYRGMRFEYV